MASSFINDFNERCRDVDIFMDMLRFIDSIATNKKVELKGESHNGIDVTYMPGRDIQQISRANFYIILYNLIEATANTIITTIKDTVNDAGVSLKSLSNNIREIYVRSLFNNISNDNKLHDLRMSLIRQAEECSVITFEKFSFNTSGNVDFDTIQALVSKIGCRGKICVDESSVKLSMERARTCRNKLAHGNESFSDFGSHLILSDIESDYSVIKQYLLEVLQNLDSYINGRKYLKGD